MRRFLKAIAIVVAMAITCLFVGCVTSPSTVEKGKKRMEKSGYAVTVRVLESSEIVGYGEITLLYAVRTADENRWMVGYYFASTETAEYYFKRNSQPTNALKHALEFNSTPDNEKNFLYEQNGQWVFYAHKKAQYDFTY